MVAILSRPQCVKWVDESIQERLTEWRDFNLPLEQIESNLSQALKDCSWREQQKQTEGSLSDTTLKWKGHYFDEIVITGCTMSCQNDNFWYEEFVRMTFPLQWTYKLASDIIKEDNNSILSL